MEAEAGDAGTKQHHGEAASTSGATVPFDRSSSRFSVPGSESFDGALRIRCAARRFSSAVEGRVARACRKLTGRRSWLCCRSSRI
jgi:hypothetical protein